VRSSTSHLGFPCVRSDGPQRIDADRPDAVTAVVAARPHGGASSRTRGAGGTGEISRSAHVYESAQEGAPTLLRVAHE
jgi:hypothetical protein